MRARLLDALAVTALVALCYLATLWLAGTAQAQVPPAANAYKRTLIRAAQAEWGLGAPVAVFAAQVHQESGWRPDAVSRVGARGLAQFMPATAAWWCDSMGLSAQQCQPHNPTWALRALVGYDRYLHDRTPARYAPHDRMWVALRAYNGGLGHWQAEARMAAATAARAAGASAGDGLREPTRAQVDAACGQARRAAVHCAENLAYPRRILIQLQPRYATWGPGL